MRRILVIFMTKQVKLFHQDSIYMLETVVRGQNYPDIEQEILNSNPNIKDILYIFDGWPNRIT